MHLTCLKPLPNVDFAYNQAESQALRASNNELKDKIRQLMDLVLLQQKISMWTGDREVVLETHVKMDAGWVYLVNPQGDIYRMAADRKSEVVVHTGLKTLDENFDYYIDPDGNISRIRR